MELTLHRRWFTDITTIGELLIDGVHECWTLEDKVREPGVKVDGQTAIPYGRYRVIIDESNRFRTKDGKKRRMPHILDVPMFDGIRIHSGNTASDTEGCPLVGRTHAHDWIGESAKAFDAFFPKLEEGLKQGEVWITIIGDTEARDS